MRCTFAVFAIGVSWGSAAIADEDTGGWRFEIAPYLWLPTIGGDLNYELPPGGGTGSGTGAGVSVGPTDWLELLNFAALVSASASRDRLTLFTDFVYLSLEKDDGGRVESVDAEISGAGGRITIPVSADLNTSVDSGLTGFYINLAAGYTFHASDSGTHMVFGGARHFDLETDTDWDLTIDITTPDNEVALSAQGSIARSESYWDAIVGLRGSFALGDGKWSVPYYLDVGTGDTELTWTAQALLAYEFGWGTLGVGYRHLEYDEGSGGLLQDFSFSGPGIGARFSF